jgi:hypothetical protein
MTALLLASPRLDILVDIDNHIIMHDFRTFRPSELRYSTDAA